MAPRAERGKEGYEVRVDLLNTSERAITLRAGWRNDDAGDLKDYIDAATSIECVPPVRRWMGGVIVGRRKSPQPEQVLEKGAVLSVRWQTQGRHLKNRVTNPNEVQNPEFPFPGLYSVHATLNVITSERTVPLRSNEQLVSVGGSRALPKSTLGQLAQVEADGSLPSPARSATASRRASRAACCRAAPAQRREPSISTCVSLRTQSRHRSRRM